MTVPVGREVRRWGTIANRPDQLRRLSEKRRATPAYCCEAVPCGYGLHRQQLMVTELGHDCVVVVPSLIPVRTATG